jgi:16S rRNA C967 or C1407 C5-methylase (RsmB/RsmF family)
MVYSTCSLSVDQNEKVVQYLLDTSHDSFIIPVEFTKAKSTLVLEGSIPGTIRFLPNVGGVEQDDDSSLLGGGFFLAKLGKRK